MSGEAKLQPVKYGISIEHSRELVRDTIIRLDAEWFRECARRAEEYAHDMLTLSPEELAKKYPPPEVEYCECCGQEICDD